MNGDGPSTNMNGHLDEVTEDQLQQHTQTISNHSGSRFVFFRQDHSLYLKGNCNAAAVLAYMLNIFLMKTGNPKDRERLRKDGLWFMCPAKGIQEYFGMGEDKQRSAVSVLETTGLIETVRKKGIPPTQWVRISTQKLEEIERESAKPKNGETPDSKTELPKTGKPRQGKRGNPGNNKREIF